MSVLPLRLTGNNSEGVVAPLLALWGVQKGGEKVGVVLMVGMSGRKVGAFYSVLWEHPGLVACFDNT